MHLGRTLSRNGQVGAIEHWFVRRHVVINNFENYTEFTDHYLTRVLLIPEESQVLSDTYTLHISQLAHHLSKLNDAFSQKARASI